MVINNTAYIIKTDVESYQRDINEYMVDCDYECINDKHIGWRYYRCNKMLEWDFNGVTMCSQSAVRTVQLSQGCILVAHYGGGMLTLNVEKLARKYSQNSKCIKLGSRMYSHMSDDYIRDNIGKWAVSDKTSHIKSISSTPQL